MDSAQAFSAAVGASNDHLRHLTDTTDGRWEQVAESMGFHWEQFSLLCEMIDESLEQRATAVEDWESYRLGAAVMWGLVVGDKFNALRSAEVPEVGPDA